MESISYKKIENDLQDIYGGIINITGSNYNGIDTLDFNFNIIKNSVYAEITVRVFREELLNNPLDMVKEKLDKFLKRKED